MYPSRVARCNIHITFAANRFPLLRYGIGLRFKAFSNSLTCLLYFTDFLLKLDNRMGIYLFDGKMEKGGKKREIVSERVKPRPITSLQQTVFHPPRGEGKGW